MDTSTYQAKRQRLAALELRAARYGIDTPAEVLIEIMDLRRELRRSIVLNVRASRFDVLLSVALVLALVALVLIVAVVLGGLLWMMLR